MTRKNGWHTLTVIWGVVTLVNFIIMLWNGVSAEIIIGYLLINILLLCVFSAVGNNKMRIERLEKQVLGDEPKPVGNRLPTYQDLLIAKALEEKNVEWED